MSLAGGRWHSGLLPGRRRRSDLGLRRAEANHGLRACWVIGRPIDALARCNALAHAFNAIIRPIDLREERAALPRIRDSEWHRLSSGFGVGSLVACTIKPAT